MGCEIWRSCNWSYLEAVGPAASTGLLELASLRAHVRLDAVVGVQVVDTGTAMDAKYKRQQMEASGVTDTQTAEINILTKKMFSCSTCLRQSTSTLTAIIFTVCTSHPMKSTTPQIHTIRHACLIHFHCTSQAASTSSPECYFGSRFFTDLPKQTRV